MIGILGDHHVGDGRFRRHPAFDQPGGGRRLQHDALAGAAAVTRTTHHQNLEPRGDHIQPLGPVLADHMQGAGATWAGLVLDIEDRLDARQMAWKLAAVGAPQGLHLRTALGILRLNGGGFARFGLLDIFQTKLQLVDGKGLRPTAEAMALHLLDDLAQPCRLCRMSGAFGQDQRLKRVHVGWQGVGQSRHDLDYSTTGAL